MCLIFVANISNISPTSQTPVSQPFINILQSSLFDSAPAIRALIKNTQDYLDNGHTLESDFNRIVFAYMRYFPLHFNELFLPEVWSEDQANRRLRCDGLFGTVNTNIMDVNYGKLIAKMMFEGKNYTAIA